ncbi:MAG TPA: hypothetical protein VIJ66_01330 [Solirubrobacteraceae bacterium]
MPKSSHRDWSPEWARRGPPPGSGLSGTPSPMSEYDVQITEIVELTADDRATMRIARIAYWRAGAESDEDAKAAWDDWGFL